MISDLFMGYLARRMLKLTLYVCFASMGRFKAWSRHRTRAYSSLLSSVSYSEGVTPLLVRSIEGYLGSTQYTKGWYAERKNPIISYTDISFYFKKGPIFSKKHIKLDIQI